MVNSAFLGFQESRRGPGGRGGRQKLIGQDFLEEGALVLRVFEEVTCPVSLRSLPGSAVYGAD